MTTSRSTSTPLASTAAAPARSQSATTSRPSSVATASKKLGALEHEHERDADPEGAGGAGGTGGPRRHARRDSEHRGGQEHEREVGEVHDVAEHDILDQVRVGERQLVLQQGRAGGRDAEFEHVGGKADEHRDECGGDGAAEH